MNGFVQPAIIASLLVFVSGCDGVLGSVIKPDMSSGTTPEPIFGDQAALASKAAALTQARTADYLCDNDTAWMQVSFLGGEQMISVSTVHNLTLAPHFLECSPTRAGPNCTAGTLGVMVNTVTDKLQITETESELDMSCNLKIDD